MSQLVVQQHTSFSRHKGVRALTATFQLAGVRVVAVHPLTYMNESGSAVAPLAQFYRVPPAQIVVVHDELDLPLGSQRIKMGGGDGGHNGLKSIRASLKTGDYFRVRVGISRPPGNMPAANYVLARFTKAEQPLVAEQIQRSIDAVDSLLTKGLTVTQNTYNS